MSTITELSPDVINITIILHHQIGANARVQGIYKNEQYKRHSRVYKRKTREAHRGAWKDRAPDDLLEIHATTALL